MSNLFKLDLREQSFIKDFITFCHESMDHCVRQAEVAASEIIRVMQFLLDDSKRITKMSQQTLDAVRRLKDSIDPELNGDSPPPPAAQLIHTLREFAKQYRDIQDILNPVIEALQFQDRVRQNMGNLLKMMGVWLGEREQVRRLGVYGDSQRKQFGERLLKTTTMKEERDIVRYYIPQLPQDESAPEEPLFF